VESIIESDSNEKQLIIDQQMNYTKIESRKNK
jgi:hypothetical protein